MVGLTAALVATLVATLIASLASPIAHAQPAPAPPAAGDLERARDLYRSGEAAMKDGRFGDAARDYGASYELSKDPALFFKIGRAHERAGKCETALIYYARYLREGSPAEQFTALTRERIAACGGSVPGSAPAAPTPDGAPGSVAPAPSDDAPAGPDRPTTGTTAPPATAAPPATPAPTVTGVTGAPAAGSGSSAPALIPSTRHKIAWLMSGSAIALVTLGGVLAYAASSSENDVRDLYAGFAGQPPAFDAATRKRYDELVDQGRSYQHLSWTAFGLGGAAAVGAALLFTLGGEEPAGHARVTPVISPSSAGVAVQF